MSDDIITTKLLELDVSYIVSYSKSSKLQIINHICCISFLPCLQQVVTVSRTRLTPEHLEMLMIRKNNSSRLEEIKVITSYEIKNKNVVIRGAVEVIGLI